MAEANRDRTTEDICRAFDIREATLRRWIGMGCPCTQNGSGKRRSFNEDEVRQWMQANNLTGQMGRPKPPRTPQQDALAAAKLRKEIALAARAELLVEREKGLLVERAEVERQSCRKIEAVRNKLMGLGAGLAGQLEGQDAAEIQRLIDERCQQICDEFSRG